MAYVWINILIVITFYVVSHCILLFLDFLVCIADCCAYYCLIKSSTFTNHSNNHLLLFVINLLFARILWIIFRWYFCIMLILFFCFQTFISSYCVLYMLYAFVFFLFSFRTLWILVSLLSFWFQSKLAHFHKHKTNGVIFLIFGLNSILLLLLFFVGNHLLYIIFIYKQN